MNQQAFAAIVASVISTYFGALILMYILRTFLAWFFSQTSSAPVQPTVFHGPEVEAWTPFTRKITT